MLLLRCDYATLLAHWHKHAEKHRAPWEWARQLECLGRFSPRSDGPWELVGRDAARLAGVLREHRRELEPPSLPPDFAPERHLTAYRLWLGGHPFDEAGCADTRRAAGLCRYIFVASTLLGLDPQRASLPPGRLVAQPAAQGDAPGPPSGVFCRVHPGWARPDCAGWVPLERCRLVSQRRHRYVFALVAPPAAQD